MMFNWLGSTFSAILSVLYFLVIVTTIVIVIMENRNPVKTLAWVLVLSFLPIVGLVLYFFFGQDRRKEKLIGKRGYARLMRYPLKEYQQQRSVDAIEKLHPAMRFFRNVSGAFPFEGNEVETYTEGMSFLQSLLKAIASAKHHIHLEFYIFEDDAVGRLVRDALVDKAKQGVEVRVLYDDVGCWKVPRLFFDNMRSEGIETHSFLKVHFPRFTSKVNFRNHRKMVVIDGKVGFIGGMNLALRYVRGVEWGKWRDTHLKITGRAVYGLQAAFLTDWYAVDQSLITSSVYYPSVPDCQGALAQVVTSDPIGEWRDIMQGLLVSISTARTYFYVQTPYLLPTEPILVALKTSALAGVDVRIMIPEKGDSWLTQRGTHSYLQELMQAGVKIFLYQGGFLHSKLMVSDDVWATVGSTNMDFRSFEHNFEANVILYDEHLAKQLKAIFIEDEKDATLLQSADWKGRPWYQKVSESIIRLFAPLL